VEELSAIVLDTSLRIHRALGPGLLESAYEIILAASFEKQGLRVDRQMPISIAFEDIQVSAAFRADMIIEERLLLEIKSVEALTAVHAKQVITYLRLMDLPLGLLINFGGATLKEGVRRLVNNHTHFASSRLRANQIS
jgi:iron complex transport system substrate-binding protein